MRPRPIVWFERVVLLAYGFGLLSLALEWRDWLERMHGPAPVVTFWIAQVIYFGGYALLIWLISRRGNLIARWIFVALVVGTTILFALSLPPARPTPIWTMALVVAQLLLTLVSLGLIFGPDTGPWFHRSAVPVDPEIFR